MSHFLGPMFELFGISAKTQFVLFVMTLLAWFVVYSIRTTSHGRVFAVIFVVLGFSLFVLLFTESPQVRAIALATFALVCVAAFAWHAHRRSTQERGRSS